LLFLTNLGIFCSSVLYGGGATLPGRFVFANAALFLPFLAVTLDRPHRVIAGWTFFLGLISVQAFALELIYLPRYRLGFASPAEALPVIFPLLQGKFAPYDHARDPGLLFAAILFMGTLCMFLFISRRHAWIQKALLGGILLVAAWKLPTATSAPRPNPSYNARLLARHGRVLDRARIERTGGVEPTALFDIADLLHRAKVASVTTMVLDELHKGRTISQPRLPPPPPGETHAWATLTAPFWIPPGTYAMQWSGHLEGRARIFFSFRVGGQIVLPETELHPNPQGQVSFHALLTFPRAGDFYTLARIEGAGTLRVDRMSLAPFDPSWESHGIIFPCQPFPPIEGQTDYPEVKAAPFEDDPFIGVTPSPGAPK
jgi:hypothetical protein